MFKTNARMTTMASKTWVAERRRPGNRLGCLEGPASLTSVEGDRVTAMEDIRRSPTDVESAKTHG